VLGIIPYLGVMVSILPAIVLGIVQFGDWRVFLVVGVFALVQTLESFVISPKIIGDRVGMHPLTIIIAIMVGTTLMGGILGGVLAIPLTAALRTLMFRYVWLKRSGSDLEKAVV
jgi:predicted PurR-regulated permease PerM